MASASLMMREGCKESDTKRDMGLTTPEDILRFDNISYGTDAMQVLDVYRPKGKEGKLPVIVSVHGGGWVYGDKDVYQYYCMNLAQRGFAVVNFTYRLSPEYKFPCHLEDTVNVFIWVLKNAETYGFDMNRCFAVGDSAGGNILALFCVLCTNPKFAENFDFKAPKDFVPKAIALNCGVYDMELAIKGESNTSELIGDIFQNGGTAEELELASPLYYINEKFPPCFIMTSNEDFLKDQPEPLMEKLDKLGVSYKYQFYGTEENVLYHVFHLDIRTEEAIVCNDEECAYFQNF
ncbi:MAG: alpha/beta hydrolase [Lachnospiraceae bacterium]|nr:alpha/beta hydrolase [Lachnospiraceae bacterium]